MIHTFSRASDWGTPTPPQGVREEDIQALVRNGIAVKLVRALYAFYRQLVGGECEHARLRDQCTSGKKTGTFCPDCGYNVQMLWAMVRCRNCIGKRIPRKNLDGTVAPMYRYCEHCGSTDFQVIKKPRLAAYEMPYAVMCAEVDYSEGRQPTGANPLPPKEYRSPRYNRLNNPFAIFSGENNIVDGEVIRSEFVGRA